MPVDREQERIAVVDLAARWGRIEAQEKGIREQLAAEDSPAWQERHQDALEAVLDERVAVGELILAGPATSRDHLVLKARVIVSELKDREEIAGMPDDAPSKRLLAFARDTVAVASRDTLTHDQEVALNDLAEATLFLTLALEDAFHEDNAERKGAYLVHTLTDDQVDAAGMALSTLFRAVRATSKAFMGVHTVGSREHRITRVAA